MIYPGSLHNHTQMSNLRLLDCIIHEEDLIRRAIELGHSVVAVTDHETIASAVRVEKIYKKIKAENIPLKVIMGNEIYLCRDGLNETNFVRGEDKYYHFILLAKDLIGYQQICEISTRAWKRSYVAGKQRRVPTYYQDLIDIIQKNPGHVIGSSACLGGMLPTQLLKYKETQSEALWLKIINWCYLIESVFGRGNFYLELQPSATEEQTYVNRQLIKLSQHTRIPYIITTDSHYLKKEDRPIHKAYLNSQDKEREVDSFYATTYLMDTEDLEDHLDLTREELDTAYNNILEIGEKCQDYSILKSLKIPSLKWKTYNSQLTTDWIEKIPMLQIFNESEFNGDRELVKAVLDGIATHSDLQNQEAYDEINSNLEMTWVSSNVNKAHWSAYYLNLQQIIDLCWEAGSLVGPGRGSGVGFILLYVLGITQINPLREKTRTFAWRFLNPERVSVLDVDFDIEGSKRAAVLRKFREFYGEDRVANVTTFRTEKSKAAILTAARGLGIDVDEAQYLASLIPADRGQLRTLKQVYYGDEEKDMKPIASFVKAMSGEYKELWAVAQKIEGLICGSGIHAGGVIFVDEPFTNSTGLMRAPDGTICTQFDLHDAEDVSLIKYDALSVEAEDKIHVCLDLLVKYGYIIAEPTLKETYEKVLGIYKIDRDSKDMWEMIWHHKILSLFQMEKQSGIKGISILRPTSVDDLAVLNSTIRLMAQEGSTEMPTDKLARFKRRPKDWDVELHKWGLGDEEKKILEPILNSSYGLCIAQEQFMELVQLPELGGFSLTWADGLRKSIAKKNPAAFDKLTEEFYQKTAEKGVKENFAKYVWQVLISMSKGYGFNQSHTLAYSLVALQEMNLAYHYPMIFWNTANLITDSGELEENGNTDYTKIANAIGKIMQTDTKISLVDINTSDFGFKPDAINNRILFGLKAMLNVGDDVIDRTIKNRPYISIKDYYYKVKPNKQAMISLIKGGAFDTLMERKLAMAWYIWETCDKKKNLTLSNLPGLIRNNLLPEDTEDKVRARRIYEFNRYLKAKCKVNKTDIFYHLDERAITFLIEIERDDMILEGETLLIKAWEKVYHKEMDVFRTWLAENKEQILTNLNSNIFYTDWTNYATGNYSSWEMEALCFYYHEHELAHVNYAKYGLSKFSELPEEPVVDRIFKKGDKEIRMYQLTKICGTCIAKNKDKGTVSLLTTDGVVSLRFRKEYFSLFDKQISERGEDGVKHVVEKSWFNRGNKIIVQGMRSGNEFIVKKYASSGGHQLYKIDKIEDNGDLLLKTERYQGVIEDE